MLKKRIIFTLLYDSGSFVLSRNFRLQKVGNLEWLQRNYDFSRIAFFIDELILLNVTRSGGGQREFSEALKSLTAGCFLPTAAGGGIRSVDDARLLLRSGADKVVINTPLFDGSCLARDLVEEFGQQCIVGSVDLKSMRDGSYRVITCLGETLIDQDPHEALSWIKDELAGEIYLNSIDRDGTGQGYDFGLLDVLPVDLSVPVILAGGVGNGFHLQAGLEDPRVDAVATAHLLNFVGDGLQRAREGLRQQGIELPFWMPLEEFYSLCNQKDS